MWPDTFFPILRKLIYCIDLPPSEGLPYLLKESSEPCKVLVSLTRGHKDVLNRRVNKRPCLVSIFFDILCAKVLGWTPPRAFIKRE
jgi:hypothetical protein